MARSSTALRLLLRYGPKTPIGWLLIGVLAVVYLFAQPALNRTLGLNLPGLFDAGHSGEVRPDESPRTSPVGGRSAEQIADAVNADVSDSSDVTPESREVAYQRADAPPTDEPGGTRSDDAPAAGSKDAAKAPPPLGKLTEVGDMVFETTAGLIYTRGSADGHRLKHVMKHAVDDPSRPVHSVFEPGEEHAVFAVIDEAYLIADLEGPPRARKQSERGRTIWLVDMRRTVGYVGGQKGRRKGYPKVRGIKLVLEGRNVITAFPDDLR